MTNILYISTTSQIGGGPEHLYSLLKGLDRSKYTPIVAAPDNGEYFERFQQYADVIALKAISKLPENYKTLQKVVKERNIDIVHSHGRGAGLYSRFLKMKNPSIKAVHTFHGIHYEQGSLLVRGLKKGSDKFLRPYTDAFICVSNKEREDAITNGFADADKTYVIYNGIDSSRFDIDIDIEKYRKSIGLEADDYVIGYVARMVRTKGHRELLEAFIELGKEREDARLLLIGDGAEWELLDVSAKEAGFEGKVMFLGVREDIPQLLKCMDMFVSPTFKEGMPYNLMEALATGIPTVATDVTGNSEIIKDGINGILCRRNDSQDLYKAMQEMSNIDAEIKESYIAKGKAIVEEHFSVRKMVSDTQDVYEGLLF